VCCEGGAKKFGKGGARARVVLFCAVRCACAFALVPCSALCLRVSLGTVQCVVPVRVVLFARCDVSPRVVLFCAVRCVPARGSILRSAMCLRALS